MRTPQPIEFVDCPNMGGFANRSRLGGGFIDQNLERKVCVNPTLSNIARKPLISD